MTEGKGIPPSIKQMWQNFQKTVVNAAVKKKKKPEGKLLWDSSKGKTYVKKKHGELK